MSDSKLAPNNVGMTDIIIDKKNQMDDAGFPRKNKGKTTAG
jgi:hypothetical protein